MQRRRALPDSNRSLTPELENKVRLLEKALIRERNAKKQLELKLEEKKEVEFNKNKELLAAFENATSRQLQLQFLSLLTQDLLLEKNIDELFSRFILNLSKLLEHCPAVQMSVTDNLDKTISACASPESEWKKVSWLSSYDAVIDDMFKQEEAVWHRLEIAQNNQNSPFFQLMNNTTVLYLIIYVSKTQKRIICLDINHYCYSEDFKQTLSIAAKQFSSMIKRRLTEVELSYNYQILTRTISELKSTQKQLLHNEKMASLGQLAAGVAHEINNPIGYVTSNLDVLKDYINVYENTLNSLPEEQLKNHHGEELGMVRADINELIDSCINGVDRVSEIVLSLKTFSRKEINEMSEVNLNDVVEDALKIVWNQLKYNYQIHQNLSDDIALISGNAGQLQQVFVNLFVNATQAMNESGELTITSKNTDEYVEISVSDTGCGMDDNVMKHLFEPFYTTKKQNEGTGLGLSVSYAIIEKHNALVNVESEPQKGTTFTIRFLPIQ